MTPIISYTREGAMYTIQNTMKGNGLPITYIRKAFRKNLKGQKTKTLNIHNNNHQLTMDHNLTKSHPQWTIFHAGDI